jgi:hypothetical protein
MSERKKERNRIRINIMQILHLVSWVIWENPPMQMNMYYDMEEIPLPEDGNH